MNTQTNEFRLDLCPLPEVDHCNGDGSLSLLGRGVISGTGREDRIFKIYLRNTHIKCVNIQKVPLN